MKYVLDASVALKWVLPELDSDKAGSFRDRFSNQIDELIAPDTFPVEVAHSLTCAERKGIIQPPEAIKGFNEIAATLPYIHGACPCSLTPWKYPHSSALATASTTASTSPWPNGNNANW